MGFLRRIFGRAGEGQAESIGDDALAADEFETVAVEAPPPPALVATCPYCGIALAPPPERSRRCPSCREPIIVRHRDGRRVLLAETSVVAFDRERQRVIDQANWTIQRERWLKLADGVHPRRDRRERLAKAVLSAEIVDASRSLYLASVENAVRAARRSRRWPEVARIRRQQATTLFLEAGSPVPAPDAIVELQRDGMLAELRALAVDYADAELVGAGCCRICRAEDGKVFRIAAELRQPRLPHDGCSKGLCACEWWLGMRAPKKRRRTVRPRVAETVPPSTATQPDEAGATVPDAFQG